MSELRQSDDRVATRRELATLLIAAGFFRAAVCAAVLSLYPVTFEQYVFKGDGESYLAYAAALSGEVELGELDVYHRRVFPGYPALIALLHTTGLPLSAAALLLTWTAAGAAAALAARLFDDRRIGYAIALLPPHYVINSSLAMSESVMLCLSLAGLLVAAKRPGFRAAVAAGCLLGCAGLVRPMACFAVLAAIVVRFRRADKSRRWSEAALVALVSLVVVVAGYGLLHVWSGDAAEGVRVYRDHPGAYAGRLLALPFESLIVTPQRDRISAWRVVYIWPHVIIVLAACGMTLVRVFGRRLTDGKDAMAAAWLWGNTMFTLCIGHPWGFAHFPRFAIAGNAPLAWALRNWLPTRRRWWLLLAGALFVLAVAGARDSP